MPKSAIESAQDQIAAWHPWSTASERGRWDELPELVRLRLLTRAKEAAQTPWPDLPASLFLEYGRTGNRRHGEDAHFLRRHILRDLVLGACVAGDGSYVDDAIDAIWSICEETFWGIPAHSQSRAHPNSSLPVENDPVIDLFAAETAASLAWARYLLEEQLASLAPGLADRIVREIDRRILTPFLGRDDWHWLGVQATHAANWTPWVCSNVILCALLCEPDQSRQADQLAKSVAALDVYVFSLPDDGGCSEGPSYWTRGPGALFDSLDALESASAGRLNGFSIPVLSRLPHYLVTMHLNGRVFVQHSDGHGIHTGDAITLYRFAHRVGDTTAQQLAFHMRDTPAQVDLAGASLNRSLQDTFTPGWQAHPSGSAPALAESWLPELEVGSVREHPGSVHGLTLIAKAGHNSEDHNHNDVGSFTVAVDGEPVVIDPGVGTYTRETFGPGRYDIWTMRSDWHNLPVVNGHHQVAGTDHRAHDVYWSSAEKIGLLADIARAWASEVNIISWKRDVQLSRTQSAIVLHDQWRLSEAPESIDLPLTVSGPIEIVDGGAIVHRGDVKCRIAAPGLELRIEKLDLKDENLQKIWGPTLHRLICSVPEPGAVGDWTITFSAER